MVFPRQARGGGHSSSPRGHDFGWLWEWLLDDQFIMHARRLQDGSAHTRAILDDRHILNRVDAGGHAHITAPVEGIVVGHRRR
jgi:hypothetical protein